MIKCNTVTRELFTEKKMQISEELILAKLYYSSSFCSAVFERSPNFEEDIHLHGLLAEIGFVLRSLNGLK